MSDSVQLLQQANDQRTHAQRATLDALKGKKRPSAQYETVLDDGGEPVSFKLVAMKPQDYDDLVTLHPPTDEQKKKALDEGFEAPGINVVTFPPALLEQVCTEPKLTVAEWEEAVFKNDNWGNGERSALFWAANALCRRGLQLTPFD